MNNNKILKQRWNKIDKLISSFIKENNKLSKEFYDNLQNVFDGIRFTYEDLYKYANLNYIGRLHRKILDLKEQGNLTGYIGYQLNKLYNKNKLRNSEVLIGLLMIEYYKHNNKQDEIENILFKQVSEITYEQTQQEVKKELKPKKFKMLSLPDAFLYSVLITPFRDGATWKDFKEGNIVFNVKQVFSLVKTKMSLEKVINVYDEDMQKILEKQKKSYINKKKLDEVDTDNYIDQFSGSLDTYISFLTNQIALEGMKRQGVQEVIFVAVLDEKTTLMCQTLDGQVFSIYEWNTFDRYSDIDKKNVVYKVKGLEVGANLPPIDNHFHYCRSTIYPYK